MKKTVYLIWMLAGILIACNSNIDVEITQHVTPPEPPAVITYNQATGSFGGFLLENNSAYYTLDLCDAANTNVGLRITAFSSVPNSFATFRCDEGAYTHATSYSARTFLPGTMSGGNASGTYLYDLNTNSRTLITGGSFTVAFSNNVYTFTTDFTGVDATTGATVNDIKISYSGAIAFADKSIIENASYTATGSPKFKSSPGPNSWSGMFEFAQTGRYRITNWSNLNMAVYCNFDANGTIQINNKSMIHADDLYEYYFELGYIEIDNNGFRTITINLDPVKYGYLVHYNPFTRVLDFSGTLTVDGKDYEAVVGIAGWGKTSGDPEIAYSDFYANLKLQLTPAVTSSSAGAVMLHSVDSQNIKMRSQSSKQESLQYK